MIYEAPIANVLKGLSNTAAASTTTKYREEGSGYEEEI